MNDWWKAPILHGDDNDYGQYDYLIEELPHDYVKWELSEYKCRCDSCGKERYLFLRAVSYFYTLDGYDYMDNVTCWKCRLEEKIWSIKNRFKKKITVLKTTIELYQISPKWNWKKSYDCALKMVR